MQIDAIAFGKRKAVDREMREAEPVAMPNAVFDESGNFLVFSTVIGIKVRGNCGAPLNVEPPEPFRDLVVRCLDHCRFSIS